MVGFLRRFEPGYDYGQPLEVTALVVDDGRRRVVLVGLDMLAVAGQHALALRDAIAAAAGTRREAVFVNCQHTHAAPPPPGVIKMGGLVHQFTDDERGYWNQLVRDASSAARLATRRLQPARAGSAATTIDGLSVNRRERLADGMTILGWNPEAPCDRSLGVLRLESMNGEPLGTVVQFACHPVVIGPDVAQFSSDYVGPLRDTVRSFTGGDCLFLQGCAGNILPLESFQDMPGPEVTFGRALALAALRAWAEAEVRPRQLERTEYRSAVPIARYRRMPTGVEFDNRVDFAEVWVALPLDSLPSAAEMSVVRRDLESRARTLKEAGAGPDQWNPLEIHATWAAAMEEHLNADTAERVLHAPVQVIRLGRRAIVGLPGEPFNEIGTYIKDHSPADFTLCCGYTNDAVGYLPTSEEHPYGGYEVAVNHRHYGHAAPIARGCDRVLQKAAVELLHTLFDRTSDESRMEKTLP